MWTRVEENTSAHEGAGRIGMRKGMLENRGHCGWLKAEGGRNGQKEPSEMRDK